MYIFHELSHKHTRKQTDRIACFGKGLFNSRRPRFTETTRVFLCAATTTTKPSLRGMYCCSDLLKQSDPFLGFFKLTRAAKTPPP